MASIWEFQSQAKGPLPVPHPRRGIRERATLIPTSRCDAALEANRLKKLSRPIRPAGVKESPQDGRHLTCVGDECEVLRIARIVAPINVIRFECRTKRLVIHPSEERVVASKKGRHGGVVIDIKHDADSFVRRQYKVRP